MLQRILAKMPAHIAASQTKSAQIYELIVNMISCVRPIVHSSKCGVCIYNLQLMCRTNVKDYLISLDDFLVSYCVNITICIILYFVL